MDARGAELRVQAAKFYVSRETSSNLLLNKEDFLRSFVILGCKLKPVF